MRSALRADLVQTLVSVDHPSTLDLEGSEGFCEGQAEVSRVDAHDHELRPRWVEQGSEDVEESRVPQLTADGGNQTERRVAERCEEVEERIGE